MTVWYPVDSAGINGLNSTKMVHSIESSLPFVMAFDNAASRFRNRYQSHHSPTASAWSLC
jgi:hypothetical protein